MYSKHHDIYKFIERIKDRGEFEIIVEIEKVLITVERALTKIENAAKFADELKMLAFYLNNKKRPAGIDDTLYSAFQNLIKKG